MLHCTVCAAKPRVLRVATPNWRPFEGAGGGGGDTPNDPGRGLQPSLTMANQFYERWPQLLCMGASNVYRPPCPSPGYWPAHDHQLRPEATDPCAAGVPPSFSPSHAPFSKGSTVSARVWMYSGRTRGVGLSVSVSVMVVDGVISPLKIRS